MDPALGMKGSNLRGDLSRSLEPRREYIRKFPRQTRMARKRHGRPVNKSERAACSRVRFQNMHRGPSPRGTADRSTPRKRWENESSIIGKPRRGDSSVNETGREVFFWLRTN